MNLKRIAIIIFTFIMLNGCMPAAPQQTTIPIPTAAELPQAKRLAANSIRISAIKDTALSYSAQSALTWRSQQINSLLQNEQDYLSEIFNFNALMLKNNVLPPVLAEGDSALNMDSPYALRLADKVYKIVQPPQFVTAVPTWRDYLWMDYPKPDLPDATLLPKTPQEKTVWDTYAQKGWNAGIQQANEIFSANLGRLKRDYGGMILYRKLLAQNIVTPPYVAKTNLGVTGGGTSMRVNDQVLRITATSELNANSKTWKAVVSKGAAGGGDPDVDQVDGP